MKSKHNCIVEDIEDRQFTLTHTSTGVVLTQVPYHKIKNFFIPGFASTIDSVQGSRIDVNFSIWETDHPFFNRNHLDSAIGRTVNMDLVHLDLRNSTKYFKWRERKSSIIMKPIPKNNDPEYAKTSHYVINNKGSPIYIGITTRTIQQRLNEHWKTAFDNPRTLFHRTLVNLNKDEVTIELTEIGNRPQLLKHRNLAQAEAHESSMTKSYLEAGHELLKVIKLTEVNENTVLTMERYNEIKKRGGE